MIDNCARYGIPAKIMYLNYFSTTMKLVSEKMLLDGTTTNKFCFMTVYVPVIYINHKADKCGLNYLQIHSAGYRLQRKQQIQKTKAKGKKQSTVCEDATYVKRSRSVGMSSSICFLTEIYTSYFYSHSDNQMRPKKRHLVLFPLWKLIKPTIFALN